MSEKEMLDDYYSSISKDKKESPDGSKNKIKIKPKVLIKKKTTKDDNLEKENIVSKQKEEAINETSKKQSISSENSEKISIQKAIKREEIVKKPGFNRDFYRKEGTGKHTYSQKDKTKIEDNKKSVGNENLVSNGGKKGEFQKSTTIKRDFFVKTSFNKGKDSLLENNLVEKPNFAKKDFGKDKPRGGFSSKKDSEYGDKSKKSKLSSHSKHRRFFPEIEAKEIDNSFVRSHKINKKSKETKNIEDIKQNLVSRTGEVVKIGDILSLKELSEKIGVLLPKLLSEFMKNGMMVNINSKIDFETASIIAETFDIKLERDRSEGINVEDIIKGNLFDLLVEEDREKLVDRPPVVSIMGHVDHGKTSLLDYIRQEKVAESEAGGITQSIGAYQVTKNGKKITFLDTPGHEAFTIMRSRGVKSTDIAILVVAADEGVKPQTIESINHAKEAGISIIVAMNKIDKEGVNIELLKSQLAEQGLVCEEWGGDTPMIPVSAKTGFGIDDLLEMILLVSEIKELKANPERLGIGTVLESHLDTKLGPVVTVLINAGNVSIGDNIVCKEAYGKVKILKDYKSIDVKKALSGDPVLIVGLDKVVNGGDILQVVPSSEIAKNKSTEYKDIILKQSKSKTSSLDLIMSKIKSGTLKNLKIVLKSDTNGSLEAIKGALTKLSDHETKVSIIHSGVGNITEGDILMCSGSGAILVGFGVELLGNAKKTFESYNVEYINSPIIYRITEKIEKIISGMLDTKELEIILGTATVAGIFYTSKEYMIVGLRIKEGDKIENKLKIRVIRKQKIVGKGEILSLKQGVEEVKSLEGPIECGIKFSGNIVLEEGDTLEMYKNEIQK